MFKRRKPCCFCALAFALGVLLAFILPIAFVARIEALIIIAFGWMILFR